MVVGAFVESNRVYNLRRLFTAISKKRHFYFGRCWWPQHGRNYFFTSFFSFFSIFMVSVSVKKTSEQICRLSSSLRTLDTIFCKFKKHVVFKWISRLPQHGPTDGLTLYTVIWPYGAMLRPSAMSQINIGIFETCWTCSLEYIDYFGAPNRAQNQFCQHW